MKQFDKRLNKIINESQYDWYDYSEFDPDRGGLIDYYDIQIIDRVIYFNGSDNYDGDMDEDKLPKDREDLLSLLQSRIDNLGGELQEVISIYREAAEAEQFRIERE